MTLRKGLPAKNAATDANDTRYDFNNLVTTNSDGSPRGGVVSPYTSTLLTATSTMNITVGQFNAVAARDGGAVLLANDGNVNVLLDAAPPANSRIDVIYAKQNDSSSTVTSPDPNDSPVLGVAKGTAGASPTKPSIPVGAVDLGSVQVPAGVTGLDQDGVVINPPAQFTAAPGAAVPFRTVALMNAWTNASPNQVASVFADPTSTNFNGMYMYLSGTGWVAQGGSSLPPVVLPTPQTGWTAPGARTTRIGQMLFFHWVFQKNAQAANGDLIMVLPTSLRPTDTVAIAAVSVTGGAEGGAYLTVSSSDGGVRVFGTPPSAGRTFKADGHYFLS